MSECRDLGSGYLKESGLDPPQHQHNPKLKDRSSSAKCKCSPIGKEADARQEEVHPTRITHKKFFFT